MSLSTSSTHAAPVEISDCARGNLRFIRDTIESASAFTSVSGKGGIAMGLTAVAAGGLSAIPVLRESWLLVWLAAAAVSALVAMVSIGHKARRSGVTLSRGPGRRFVFGLAPALIAGAVMTVVLIGAGEQGLIPGVWLLFYGLGVTAGGAFSVRPVLAMGLGFVVLGLVALFLPLALARTALTLGFGGLHIVAGIVVMRRYGG